MKRCGKGMTLQTVLFERTRFTPEEARKWLEKHGMKTPKADKGKRYLRYRQRSPKKCETIRFGKAFRKGIRPVYCCPK